MAWLPDDLGPDFEQRWKQASHTRRRELLAELRDLYMLLEDEDLPVLAGQAPVDAGSVAMSKTKTSSQGSLFAPDGHSEPPRPSRENPFLPRSVLDRLQASQTQATAGLRDLMQLGQERPGGQPTQTPGSASASRPPTHEQVDLERELRLKLGPMVETLIEAQMDLIKRELRLRLRAEMDRLIAEQVRK